MPLCFMRLATTFFTRALHDSSTLDTEVQLRIMHQRLVGKRLRYKDLAVGKRGGHVRVAQ